MRGFHGKRHQEMMRLRMENQELRNENFRLQEQLDSQQLGLGHKHLGKEECEIQVFDIPVAPKAQK